MLPNLLQDVLWSPLVFLVPGVEVDGTGHAVVVDEQKMKKSKRELELELELSDVEMAMKSGVACELCEAKKAVAEIVDRKAMVAGHISEALDLLDRIVAGRTDK